MTTRTFTRDQLDALGLPDECANPNEPNPQNLAVELHREQVGTRRWVSVNALVFRAPDDGKAYRVLFEQGLTEHHDDADPWNYASTVTAVEVAQQPVTVQQWQEVTESPEPAAPTTATVTVINVEAALRGYLAMLDYDLHKAIECGEETGEDTYAEEAADLFGRLLAEVSETPAGGEQA